MPRGKKFGEMVLKDGVVAGFRLSKVQQFAVDLPFNNPNTGMIEKVSHLKLVLPFTLDASTVRPVDYASANPDPSKPLQLEFHTFIRDGVPLDKAPGDDQDRMNFVNYEMVQDILHRAEYDADADDAGTLKWPLRGLNYVVIVLKEGATRNWALLKDGRPMIGGPEMVKSYMDSKKELAGTLKGILGMKRNEASEIGSESRPVNLLNLRKPATDIVTDNPGPTAEEMALVEEERTKSPGRQRPR